MGCGSKEQLVESFQSEQLKIEKIAPGTYQHVSYLPTQQYGKVPCNGMIFIDRKEAIVFDAPSNDTAALELINWLKNDKTVSIKGLIVNHFHVDCLGSLKSFHDHQIPSYASEKTIELAREDNVTVPKNSFEKKLELKIGSASIINEYLGAGHTQDNIVSYIPREKVLFGGCIVKSMNAGKGNLHDAHTADWSHTVQKIKEKFPEIRQVIPGHGKSGGPELLDYTIELFKPVQDKYYLFFLHNRFLETHDLEEPHFKYGKVEYSAIIDKFKASGIEVLSEHRRGNIEPKTYAQAIKKQIDSLLQSGVAPANITVVGTSKGGYIAQYVSTFAENPNLNFVFIGSVQESDLESFPEINFCGNILNINEKSDTFFTSAAARIKSSKLKIRSYQELELSTGLEHGFLFKALDDWINPSIDWAKGKY